MHKFFLIAITLSTLIACQSHAPKSKGNGKLNIEIPPNFKKLAPEWAKNATLYEVNIRQYSKEGTLNAFATHLPRLKKMGVDVVWLMPIFPIGKLNRKGTLGSPYSVEDFKKVNPDYGTLEDVKYVVQQAHQLGMKVILDWVPNHTAWDNVWVKEHPDFYSKNADGSISLPINEKGEVIKDWSDIADLNYDNYDMRVAMIDALQFWVREADIDGYRTDMAGLVPNDFWEEVRPVLQTMKPIFMLSEWENEPAHFQSCFEANYAWTMHHLLNDVAQGKRKAYEIYDTLRSVKSKFATYAYQLQFTSNHDENTWAGSEIERMGVAADAMAVLTFTYDGIPLIYSGQESAYNHRLAFFEKDAIDWKGYSKAEFYQTLTNLRHHNQAVWSGLDGGALVNIETNAPDKVFAYKREKNGDKVVVILNLSKDPLEVRLQGSGYEGDYNNIFANNMTTLTRNMTLKLPAWGYVVFEQTK